MIWWLLVGDVDYDWIWQFERVLILLRLLGHRRNGRSLNLLNFWHLL